MTPVIAAAGTANYSGGAGPSFTWEKRAKQVAKTVGQDSLPTYHLLDRSALWIDGCESIGRHFLAEASVPLFPRKRGTNNEL